MSDAKFVLPRLFVDRRWMLYENKKGPGVIFSVKFLFDEPPEGRRANEVKVQFDGVTQELQVGEAIVRKAQSKIWIDPASGNALVDVEVIPLG
ncbi:MAG: hypothetical protein H6923_02200 [Alphaproteobacteria bacterium]|nr:hypothetical protein [Alphaproteobacteria bacterium]